MIGYEHIFLIFLVLVLFIPTLIKLIKKSSAWKLLLYFLFYIYISYMFLVVTLPLPVQAPAIDTFKDIGIKNNYIPFVNIIDMVRNESFYIILRQLLGNIIMFVPFGFFLPVLFRKTDVKKYLLICLALSFGIEALQSLISIVIGVQYKITDIDDMILNILGGVMGYYIFNPTWHLINKITGIEFFTKPVNEDKTLMN